MIQRISGKIFALAAIGAALFACESAPDPAPAGSSEAAQITDILTMTRRDDGKFDVVCVNGTRSVVTAEQIAANQVCGGGPTLPPPGPAIKGRIFGRTDRCDGDPVVTVNANTDCFALSQTDIAWSVWQNGQCKDISDTNVRTACLQLKPEGVAVFGRSDRCEGAAVQVTEQTNCFALSPSDVAWSVWKDGACVDIGDTNQRAACLTLKPNGRVIFGRSDRCEGEPVAQITTGFDCFTLPNTGVAWSVWVDGQCKDISDTTPRAACLALEPQ